VALLPRLTDARIDASYLLLRTLWRLGDDSDLLLEGATSAGITPALKTVFTGVSYTHRNVPQASRDRVGLYLAARLEF
jgi:hypothetical protein